MTDSKIFPVYWTPYFPFYVIGQNLSHATSSCNADWETYIYIFMLAINSSKSQGPIVNQPEENGY